MASGDEQAFRELVDKYGNYLFQVVYAVLRSTKDSEDVSQEALFKIYASLPQYQYQGFKTWITRIAVNKAIDYKRAQERKKEQLVEAWEFVGSTGEEADGRPVEELVLRRQRKDEVRRQLEQLPDHYREVVVAFYMEEKSYQEIADEFGMALKTVESKLYRAKQMMRKQWKEEDKP